jgi:hypothetical protein
MTIAKCVFLASCYAIAASHSSDPTSTQDCTHSCFIAVDGLHYTYSPGSAVDVTLHNQSKHDLAVNVAMEGFESGSWVEIVGSLSDHQHAFAKMVMLSPIKVGASLPLTFNLCKTQIITKAGDSLEMVDDLCAKPRAGVELPTSLRMRIDVFVKGKEGLAQKVRSHEFKLAADQKIGL